ncbi:site-specific integrase [uncultured Algoriphagus sp.]|uniref:tyrosine-type recombinase/integrase n=1 Tax=uncultured Algoriphagus sp. TaxID=417365 RepID=UPI0025974491|nr:site-specific integrase [uncultured Algoriphagus sp.]
MARLKKIFPGSSVQLFTYGWDESKEWFVWYRAWDGSRVKIYKGINRKGMSSQERISAANRIIDDLIRRFPYVKKPDVIQHLYAYLESRTLKKKTRQTYVSRVRKFEQYYQGGGFSQNDAQGFLESLSKEGMNATSRNNYRRFYLSAFRWMVKQELWPDNPFEGTEKVPGNYTPYRYFQRPQIKQLKAVISYRDPELWLAVQWIYYCFIRPGELRLLKVSDLLFDERKVLLRPEISKNGKQQYVRIPDAFYQLVEDRWALDQPANYLFQRPGTRSPLPVNEMGNRHRTILRDLGYEKGFVLYSWKHTGAVNFVRSGGNLKSLQMQLRHHSLEQVDAYIRGLGVGDMPDIQNFPAI